MSELKETHTPLTFDAALKDMQFLIPDSLISGVHWERLLERAQILPVTAADSTFGFEVRLTDDVCGADFSISVLQDSELASYFLDANSRSQNTIENDQDQPFDSNAVIASCIMEVTDPRAFAHRVFKDARTMLEYDVVNVPTGLHPTPGVFWILNENFNRQDVDELSKWLAWVRGTTPNTKQTKSMNEVFDATVPFGRVSQVGTFIGRETAGSRLVISLNDPARLAECLASLKWLGDPTRAAKVVQICEPLARGMWVSLALDVTENGIEPRIGIELGFPGSWLTPRISAWHPLIESLIQHDWCLPEKAAGILKWTGLERLYGRGTTQLLVRGISHIKIDVRADVYAAKAYLAASRVKKRNQA